MSEEVAVKQHLSRRVIGPAWKATLVLTRIRKSLQFRLINLGEKCSERAFHERLKEYGLAHASKIFTYTTPDELRTLFGIAALLPREATLVEIGSYLGASTCFLAAAVRHSGGVVHCIDTWNNDAMTVESRRDTWQEFHGNLEPVWNMIRVIRRPIEELTMADLPSNVDFAFIDADHSYAAVRRDFQLVEQTLKRDGIVAFHDVGSHDGVTRFVGELIATCRWQVLGHEGTLMWLRRRDGVGSSQIADQN
jgi:predicted O-methyltransferase YrrM